MKETTICGQRIFVADCLEAFKAIGDCSVDNITTSPPYNLGGFHSDAKKRSYAGYSDAMPEIDYRAFIKAVIAESFRVLKDTGSFFLNMKTRIVDGIAIPPHWVLESNPFLLKQDIIWHYPSTANVDKVRFFPLFEYIFWFVKSKSFKWNSEWSVIGNVWYISHITDRDETKDERTQHPAPFPTQLAETCVLSTTDERDTVLDPFAGSCTLLKVCRMYNRDGIGFEKYFSEYENIARKRIESRNFVPSLLFEKGKKKKSNGNPERRGLDGFIK